MLKGIRILVTGSRGFIGTHLVKRLKLDGATVLSADKRDGVDLTISGSLDKFKKIDCVVHLAGTIRPASKCGTESIYENNIRSTLTVLEFCREAGAKLLFFSTYLYGKAKYLPVDEKHPVSPANAYGKSKLLLEMLCRLYNEDFGVRVIILRPFNVYGVGQGEEFVIPSIFSQIKSGQQIVLRGRNEKRDFVYIDDLVDASVRAILFKKKYFEIFNVGSGESLRISEAAKLIIEAAGCGKCKIKFVQSGKCISIPDTLCDNKKARYLLKWKPQIFFKDGIRKMINE